MFTNLCECDNMEATGRALTEGQDDIKTEVGKCSAKYVIY